MKRALPVLAPLALLGLGLVSCRRVSWQLVAEPTPERAEVASPEDAVLPLGGTADPADAWAREGHVLGRPTVGTTSASTTER